MFRGTIKARKTTYRDCSALAVYIDLLYKFNFFRTCSYNKGKPQNTGKNSQRYENIAAKSYLLKWLVFNMILAY